MSIIIEITDTTLENRSGTSTRTGKAYSMNEQTAWMHKPGQQYPDRIKLTLDQNQVPYQPGNYALAPTSYRVDRYGSIEVRPVLVPLPAQQKTADVESIKSALPEGVKASK